MRIEVKYDIKEIDNNEISSRDINSGSEIDTIEINSIRDYINCSENSNWKIFGKREIDYVEIKFYH